MTQRPTGQDDMDGEQWVELIRAFGDAKEFRVAGELATDILRTLCPADGEPTMLPSSRTLGVPELTQTHGPFWEAAQSFLTSGQRSGRPVKLSVVCHICNTSFAQLQDLRSHLVDRQAHTLKSVPLLRGRRHAIISFRKHLESKNTLKSHTPIHPPGILPCYLSPLPVLTVSVLGTTPRTSSNPLPRSWGRTSHGLEFRQLTASYPGLTAPHLAGARLVPRSSRVICTR